MRSRLRFTSVLVGALLLVAPTLSAQQVTGRVTTQSGEPLAAVQVFIAGSGIGRGLELDLSLHEQPIYGKKRRRARLRWA